VEDEGSYIETSGMAKVDKARHLVIVESPHKAGTLKRYLGSDYLVEATKGHVVDLPKAGLGVDVDNDFEPQYEDISGRKSVVGKLRAEARKAERIFLATDPDREGEAIAYHIARKLGYPEEDGRFKRVRFTEVTRQAVLAAMADPGSIDHQRVDAQQARRVLDRLVGYGLSPLLWKKISPVDPVSRQPLSAGRVQSVAVRLTVLRELERRSFRRSEYWDLRANLQADGGAFEARLCSLDGRSLATGQDFDRTTGALRDGKLFLVLDEQGAAEAAERLAEAPFAVAGVEHKESQRSPYEPFRTSTLQKEANLKLNLRATETMRIAQRLYESGHITYMRTDSAHLSEQAIDAIRDRVESQFGGDFLSAKPRRFKTRSKSAQEAHEAIRPAGVAMHSAEELGLTGREGALYALIWKRTLACQMANARLHLVTVTVEADGAEFRASGKTIEFPGFFRAYVEGTDDPEAALENREEFLPALAEGDRLECLALLPEQHQTQSPPRYTQPSLTDALEAAGVGRPGTYAPILANVVDRGYVRVHGKQLVPTFTAFAVTQLLERHFDDLVDLDFTSAMEEALDKIAAGHIDWHEYLRRFYSGEKGFARRLERKESEIDAREASTLLFEDLDPIHVRIGRFGPFLARAVGDETLTASIPPDVAPADLTSELADEILRRKQEGGEPLGTDAGTGLPVFCLTGRFGPFVQLGEQETGGEKPKRVSLPKGMVAEEVDLVTAVGLLSLPRELGRHPDSGGPVKAGIGRYGPYVVHDGEYRSLERQDDVLTVGMERALELLSQPKRGRRRSAPRLLRELGEHPDDGSPIQILEGRYGPYVKHGKTNASLPKDLSAEEVTLERAQELLAARKARGGSKGRRRGSRGRRRDSKG
jgi:DNA topoisomerase-1